ncbi:MAG: menaquinone biosynthesis protein [Thermodesulfobacteriota bacterium]
MTPIRLGRMAYINTLPVDWGLIKGGLGSLGATVRRGAPTTLNALMAEGHLDASPVSSVAAAEHAADWLVFDHLCIGSRGAVGSVILHSDVPVEELGGRSITVTSDSATATRLLQILLEGYWGVEAELAVDHGETKLAPNWEPVSQTTGVCPVNGASGLSVFSQGGPVCEEESPQTLFARRASPQFRSSRSGSRLLIGDLALKTAQSNPSGFIYDLGQAWRDYTGCGFVFGLWCVRRTFVEHHPWEAHLLYDLLRASRAHGLAEERNVVAEAARVTGLAESKIRRYYNKLDYDLDEELWEGLCHFLRLLGHDPALLQRFGDGEQRRRRLGVSGGS